ncbi:MAG: sensor histidine kinase [Candidatus Cryosericum sp.]
MREWSWSMIADLPAGEAQQEATTGCLPGSCPCACLRNMVEVLDAVSPEQAVLQAQEALGDVTGAVILSVYRQVADSGALELVATGHDAGDTLTRLQVPIIKGSMLDSVMSDGTVRWVTIGEGDVSAVGAAALHDLGRAVGVVIAEFVRGSTGTGKPSAVCLHCVASTMSVVLLRVRIKEAEDSLLTLARYRSVAELSVQVTHDFNNMMQGVLGNAALARMDILGDSPVVSSLAGIEESATRASVLARKLLNFARDSAKGGPTCDAVKVASDALDLAGTLYLKGVAVTKDLPPQPVPVRMTDNDLESALVLLIKAAVLQLRPVSGAHLTISCDVTSEQAFVRLELHGITQAISTEDRTESQRLTGAARAVADRAGASLEMTSEPGVIIVSLGVARDVKQSTPQPLQPAPHDTDLTGVHVLVVGRPSPLVMLLGPTGCVAQAATTWDEAAQAATVFAPRAVLAVIGDSGDLQMAVEGRKRLNVPVIAVCAQGIGCPPETAAAIDGVVGLPLELADLRRVLGRALR